MKTYAVSSSDAEAMTAFISGLIAATLRKDYLTEPTKWEKVEVGLLQLRLASGLLATITIGVEDDSV